LCRTRFRICGDRSLCLCLPFRRRISPAHGSELLSLEPYSSNQHRRELLRLLDHRYGQTKSVTRCNVSKIQKDIFLGETERTKKQNTKQSVRMFSSHHSLTHSLTHSPCGDPRRHPTGRTSSSGRLPCRRGQSSGGSRRCPSGIRIPPTGKIPRSMVGGSCLAIRPSCRRPNRTTEPW
jgi:hypothetical protein